MIKKSLSLVLIICCFILINCEEELDEIFTNVSGKVYANNCKVVLAIKGDYDVSEYLDDISGIDEVSLRDAEIFRGFDLAIGSDSLYNITMLSFGETYFAAIVDDGLIADRLDTLDHIGFYGVQDTLTVPNVGTLTFNIPQTINVQEGEDESDVDIDNFLEYRWVILIFGILNL